MSSRATALAVQSGLVLVMCGTALAQRPPQQLDAIMARMGDRPEWMVGQVCMVGIWGNNFDHSAVIREKWQQTLRLIQSYHVGSVILFETNFSNVPKPWFPPTPQQVATICAELQRLTQDTQKKAGLPDLPLVISIDHEGDATPWTRLRTGFTPIPSNLAIGATWDPKFAEQVGEAVGGELALVGINMLLGPVLDVNADVSKDAMGERCFGGDPRWAGTMGSAYIRGVHRGATSENRRMLVAAKHWPGHGDCDRLPDYEIAHQASTIEELAQKELVPFLAVTNASDPQARPDGLMPTHSVYPSVQGGENPYPLTLDIAGDVLGTLTTALRRQADSASAQQAAQGLEEWRKEGLIVSDALGVEALINEYRARGYQRFPYADAAQRCLLAGHDIVMLTGYGKWEEQRKVLDHLVSMYRRGIGEHATDAERRFAERVKEAARRVVATRLRLAGQPGGARPATGAASPEALARLRSLVSEHTRTLYEGRNGSWSKAVQWVKGEGLQGPAADDSIVTIEPAAFDRLVSAPVAKGLLADMLTRKQSRTAQSAVDRLTERQLRAFLTGQASSLRSQAEKIIGQTRWVIILLAHRPRTPSGMEEAGGIDSVGWSLRLIRKLPVLYAGAQRKHVAVISCEVPYYLEASDIAAVDGYLITHSKVQPYLELAVDALLGSGRASRLASPVSVPGAGYLLSQPCSSSALAPSPSAPASSAPTPARALCPTWLLIVAIVALFGAVALLWRGLGRRLRDYGRLPEVVYTFLAVDVRDSTSLKLGQDPVAVRRTFDAYHAWVRRKVEGCHGEVYSRSGDGVLCRFARAAEALDGARRLQDSMATFNAEANLLSVPLRVGIGLHTGPVLDAPREERGMVSSSTLDVAMKLQQQAEAGEVLLSSETVTRLPVRDNIVPAGRILEEMPVYRLRQSEGQQ